MAGSLSTFTGIVAGGYPIPERSEATPGLWNNIFSVISANLDTLNSSVSQFVNLSSVGTAQVIGGISTNTLRADSGNTITLLPYSTGLISKSFESGGQVYNARAFGAVGDGITDDTTALQNCITAAGNATGVVWISAGTYQHSGLTITQPVRIIGAGGQNANLRFTASTGTALTVAYSMATNAIMDCSVEGVNLLGSGNTRVTTGVYVGNASVGFTMRNCGISSFGTGIIVGNNSFSLLFDHCSLISNNQQFLYPGSLTNSGEMIRFISCYFALAGTFANAINIVSGNVDMAFVGSSIDNSQLSVGAIGGIVSLANCHFDHATPEPATPYIVQTGGRISMFGGLMLSGTVMPSCISTNDSADPGNTHFTMEGVHTFGSSTQTVVNINGGPHVTLINVAPQGFSSVFGGSTTRSLNIIGPVGMQTASGTAVAPTKAFSSEGSLGLYRSVASTLALSYGTFDATAGQISTLTLLVNMIKAQNASRITLDGYVNVDTGLIGGAGGGTYLDLLRGTAGGAVRFIDQTGAMVTASVNSLAFQPSASGLSLGTPTLPFTLIFMGDGAGLTPSYTFGSEVSLGLYRSGTSHIGLSYGGFSLPDGTALLPSRAYSSESSLGWFRSGVSTMALSYGTLRLSSGGLTLATAGDRIRIKNGTNASFGTAVMSTGSVNVATNIVTANSVIFLTDQTAGGTLGDIQLGGIRAGSGFTIQSTSVTDTSTVAWLIIEPSP